MLTAMKTALAGLPLQSTRKSEASFIEIVLYRKNLPEWLAALEGLMGPPVKAEGEKPDKKATRLAEPYGGVWVDQILFHSQGADGQIVAMFWPWQDKNHITLKVIAQPG